MRVRNKRVLKNGVLAGYVLQKDGTWKFRFLKGKRKKQRGGNALDWDLTPVQKDLISTNLGKLSNLKGITLLNGRKQEELQKDMKFLQQLNIFAVLNFIASNNNLRVLIKKILKKGLTTFNTAVGNKIKNRLIVTIEEKMNQNSHLIKASYFFIKGFGEKVNAKNVGKQIIDLIVSRKSYNSLEKTNEFKKIRNTNKKIGGPAPIFTNVRNVNNNLQTQPNRNKNTATRQIQRLYRGKIGRNNARNLKEKNTATRQIQRLYRGKKGRNTARNLKEENTANTVINEPKNNRRIINSNLNKKKKELKNIREQIKELTKYNNSKLTQRGLFNNNNNNSDLFNNNLLAEHAKNIRSKKINQKILLKKIQANSNQNKYKEFIVGINELDDSIRVLNNLIKEENKLRKNVENLKRKNNATKKIQSAFRGKKGRNRARNEQRAKNDMKKQIQINLELLIELLKEKGKRGTFNSAFGKKGYKYFARELEKYKNYKINNENNIKLLVTLEGVRKRVDSAKNPKKNVELRKTISNLANKIRKNISNHRKK